MLGIRVELIAQVMEGLCALGMPMEKFGFGILKQQGIILPSMHIKVL